MRSLQYGCKHFPEQSQHLATPVCMLEITRNFIEFAPAGGPVITVGCHNTLLATKIIRLSLHYIYIFATDSSGFINYSFASCSHRTSILTFHQFRAETLVDEDLTLDFSKMQRMCCQLRCSRLFSTWCSFRCQVIFGYSLMQGRDVGLSHSTSVLWLNPTSRTLPHLLPV